MTKTSIFRLIISIIICQAAGVIGSFFTAPSIPGWYASLNKPGITPPNWIFAPVWTALFLMMGISLFLVWQKSAVLKLNSWKALFVFSVQIILNILWSIIFFGLHSPAIAFFEILFLWTAILLTVIQFKKISYASAVLLIPYLLWVSFASLLNFSIWRIN